MAADLERSRPGVAKTKNLLVRKDLKQAFTHLYRLQKGLSKNDRVGRQDFLHYLAVAHVLAGVEARHAEKTLAERPGGK